MGTEAWKKMEEKASTMMAKKWEKERAINQKFEKLHEHNLANPITPADPVASEIPPETVDPITYNPAYYVLGYIFPQDTVRKLNKRKK